MKLYIVTIVVAAGVLAYEIFARSPFDAISDALTDFKSSPGQLTITCKVAA